MRENRNIVPVRKGKRFGVGREKPERIHAVNCYLQSNRAPVYIYLQRYS